ncbi:SpoIID/LytB domain-containing protein [Thermoanaerobacterium sp. RBIITD]|uniref:SpoIID/LytB domain-containing protein n=1 Tax=Thermoanaerobacterium sp. RBIITD TaxID=1550240 RepID=UPI000BB8DF52|nr:SpoIID/LytB domain-containing protein [Thermoanaerobacterium sp. RBIITD]SNX52659.1 stage II sporulation protein D [Thermoanaerobacterium sp. RBIITD]
MRLRKYFTFVLIFSLIIISTVSYVKASVDIPKLIKIGLFYGTTSKTSYVISATNGFKIGSEDNTGNIKYIYNLTQNNISVNKDDNYYLSMGSFNDQVTLDNELSKVASNVPNSLVGYDGNYHIYIGPYLSQSDAQSAMKNLASKFSDITLVLPDKNILLTQNNKNVFLYKADNFIYLTNLSGDNPMSIDGKRYRGFFEFLRQAGSDITAINVLPLEEYLYGVVPSEMPGSWNIEALKAQAVAARTYALYNIGKYSKYGFDLTNDTNCQAYNGFDGEYSNSTKAVDDTKGVVAIYDGKPIDAIFHSHSGGFTEDSENVYVNRVPYLRGVEDKYVFGYSKSLDNWVLYFTKEMIEQKLRDTGHDIGNVNDVKVTDKSWTGRAVKVTIYGDKGNYVLEKDAIRNFFGTKSTMLTINENSSNSDSDVYVESVTATIKKVLGGISVISPKGISPITNNDIYVVGRNGIKQINISKSAANTYTINGSGYGHGVGLSQYGARGMADHGYNYIDILKYYYKGIDVYDTINNKSL